MGRGVEGEGKQKGGHTLHHQKDKRGEETVATCKIIQNSSHFLIYNQR